MLPGKIVQGQMEADLSLPAGFIGGRMQQSKNAEKAEFLRFLHFFDHFDKLLTIVDTLIRRMLP